jgi:predicted XRE-type DNA-binding protein
MNIKRLFKKSTLVYIIIIISLAILFNNGRTNTRRVNEGFNSNNRKDINGLSDIKYKSVNKNSNNLKKEGFTTSQNDNLETTLEILLPIYEEEKQNYKTMFKNGEELFTALVDLSQITNTELINELIQPSELSDLANNIKNDVNDITNNIFTKFEELSMSEIDSYLEGEYISIQSEIINKYSDDYPEINDIIKKEINDILLEKIDDFISNNSSANNFTAKSLEPFYNSITNPVNTNSSITKPVNTNQTNNNLDNLVGNLNKSIDTIDDTENKIELLRKMTYIRNMIAPSDEENEAALQNLMEGFYNPTSTISQGPEAVVPGNPLMSEPTVTNPMMPSPKTFDGFTRGELEIIRRNQLANTPKNIDTVLIDPLKAVETVQEDLLGLLETFSDKQKSKYLNRQFDPTNRGSYLINSPTDDLVINNITNLQNYSKPVINNYSKRITSPKEQIQSILANKEYRNMSSNNTIEGFENIDDNANISNNTNMNNNINMNKEVNNENIKLAGTSKISKSNTAIFDGFIKYSSTMILNLINKLTSGSINIDAMDNNKMQSYGIIIIAIAILLFFISSSS